MKRKRAAARIAEDVKELANEVATRVRNLPWDFSQLEKRANRESGLRLANENRQRKAKNNYQRYRDIALKLYEEKPHLRRVKRHQLAQAIRAELNKTENPPSVRTIERAFGSKNKF